MREVNLKTIAKNVACVTAILLALVVSLQMLGRNLADSSVTAAAQSAQQKFKAVWEPINYKQDLALHDVFFVDDQVGWVSGDKGTILFTNDGGDTWSPQLGGDPGAAGSPISDLFFLDAKTGWARQHYDTMLRTGNGQDWQETGAVRENGVHFVSATRGFHPYGGAIRVTEDGGRNWKDAWRCRAKMEVDGLTREENCSVVDLHFPTLQVGYGVGTARITSRTEDGGATWTALIGPEEQGDQRVWKVHFTSETSGVQIRGMGDARFLRTDDGGKTWTGVVGSAGFDMRFANSSVGWSFRENGLHSYTSDGGRRWTARQTKFPAPVKAFSLPRPDRGYVVGDHGMIYRYRVVPIGYAAKGLIDAPMMPASGE